MSVRITFTPDERLGIQENMNAFISMCRNDLDTFGKDLDFEQNVWDITTAVTQKGASGRRKAWVFSTYEHASKAQNHSAHATHENIGPMQDPFLSFAKAYMRNKFALRKFTQNTPMDAMRALHDALISITHTADPTRIDGHVLDEAQVLIRKRYSQGGGYRVAGALEKIGVFMKNKRLSRTPIDWKHSVKRPSDTDRVGKNADKKRAEKLPSQESLDALAEIFNKAVDPVHQVAVAMAALLLSNPSRISELYYLRTDAEVFDTDDEGKTVYGIRWYPAKGGEPAAKWVLPSMVDLTQRAFAMIRQHTERARELALWYEANPLKLYLPEELEHLRGKDDLDSADVASILYGRLVAKNEKETRGNVTAWLNNRVPTYKAANKHSILAKFEDIEKTLLAMVPVGFPYIDEHAGLKYSEALLVQRHNELKTKKGTYPSVVVPIAYSFLYDMLGAKPGYNLFTAFGYVEEDGSAMKITTHQFRHYLNTLMQKSGKLSQIDIAKWSGRADLQQNASYNHATPKEMLELTQKVIQDGSIMTQATDSIRVVQKALIKRDEFDILRSPTAHVTEIGYCIQDYTIMPCQLFMDCYNCSSAICIKGHESNQKVYRDRELIRKQLEEAVNSEREGHFGADRWVEHYAIKLDRLDQLCAVFEDPNVPDGTVIQLSELPAVSAIENADRRRNETLGLKQKKSGPDVDERKLKNILIMMGENDEH